MKGVKYDGGKPRFSLLPKGTILEVVKVLTFGSTKYEDDNWKRVENYHARYYDALNRHIEQWWSGELYDKETGLHHLAHAVCCALFLMWFDLRKSNSE